MLLKDKDFQQDETDLAEMEKRFREMDLPEKTRRFMEDYVGCTCWDAAMIWLILFLAPLRQDDIQSCLLSFLTNSDSCVTIIATGQVVMREVTSYLVLSGS